MIVSVKEIKILRTLLEGLPVRCFIPSEKAVEFLTKLDDIVEVSGETPSKERPGIYIFTFLTNASDQVLSFRHSDIEIYGLRTIGVSGWCKELCAPSILDAMPSNIANLFDEFFEVQSSNMLLDFLLQGIYINTTVPEDSKKIGVVYEIKIDDLALIVPKTKNFFAYEILQKSDVFKQSTKYDHWSSQIIFSLFQTSLR